MAERPSPLRAGPSADEPALRELAAGTVAALVDPQRVNGHWRVRTAQGEQGWIAAADVSVDRDRGFDAPPPVPYDAAAWRPWGDADRDCRDTRAEVLLRDGHALAGFASHAAGRECEVTDGRWFDPFTGRVYGDPEAVRILHLVPLAEAHASGGWRWDADRKRAYVDELLDLSHLVVVGAPVLVMRRGRGPEDWLPPSDSYRCEYVRNWLRIKRRWKLTLDTRELVAVREVLRGCAAAAEELAGSATGSR